MKLPRLLLVPNGSDIDPATRVHRDTWINPEDISTITLSCARTPDIEIRLRSDPARKITIGGEPAKALLRKLRKPA